ncbi:MAG: NAD(P)/FAD-dependent oxidoreductase [Chitinophagaceae bacterium]
MQIEYLIIGQGICGTMLSWFLHKEGKSIIVIDDDRLNAASAVAAGIINPVTGRRYVYSWMIDTVMPFALDTYGEMGDELQVKTIFQKSIIDFFPFPKMRDAFVTRITEDDTYLHSYPDQNRFNQYFNYDFGCGEISPAYMINTQLLMAAWRKRLMNLNVLINTTFNCNNLQIKEHQIVYENITAEKIIFCDGIAATVNPWFNALPFSPNKGEAVIIECNELTNQHIFKKGVMMAPLSIEDTFWVGSNYQWEFTNELPSKAFYDQINKHLEKWLKVPFKIVVHKAAVRPATLERRPFVGFHPQFQNIGILNGMGTKGTSLAPFFANQLAQHLVYSFPIAGEADVKRFSRILSK